MIIKSHSDAPRPCYDSASYVQNKKTVSVPKSCYAAVVFLPLVIFLVFVVAVGGVGYNCKKTPIIVDNILVSK